MEIKKLSVFEEEEELTFQLPEEFVDAEFAYPVENGFNLRDGDIDNINSNFVGFVDANACID